MVVVVVVVPQGREELTVYITCASPHLIARNLTLAFDLPGTTRDSIAIDFVRDGKPYTGDVINLSGTATASYNSKDVVSANQVNIGGLTLDNVNYSLGVTLAATITPKAIIEALRKTLDRVNLHHAEIFSP